MKFVEDSNFDIGDVVITNDGWKGQVVCNIEDSKFSHDYPKLEWEYLATGLLIMSDEIGLIYYPSTDNIKKLQ